MLSGKDKKKKSQEKTSPETPPTPEDTKKSDEELEPTPREKEHAIKATKPNQLEAEVIGIVDAAGKPEDMQSAEALERKQKEEETLKKHAPEDEELTRQELENEAEESKREEGGDTTEHAAIEHALQERARLRKRTKANRFPIVGVGASAGGLEAIQEFFSNMPREAGMAFVVVTHMHPDHISLLPELISKFTTIPVTPVRSDLMVKPNNIYVMGPGKLLRIREGKLFYAGDTDGSHISMPIDHFFRSLASDQCENAICIVLSGTGSDGTLGMRSIKAESGMAMVQAPETAKYGGMPSSAAQTGLADYVARPSEMPQYLINYVNGPYAAGRPLEKAEMLPPEALRDILGLLRARTGHDFSGYKVTTIRRRIERRMNVHQIHEPPAYLQYMQENAHEVDMLFKELLISVTSFFRDPEAYQSLHQQCLPNLLKDRQQNQTLRVWVPGCCTGEEAYSIAMVLQECTDKTPNEQLLQIFGTDLDTDAIETARAGVYSAGIAVDVPPEYLERYFVHQDNVYRIRKEIREKLVFAPQNLIKDPPFTRLDMIACRNVLIYLDVQMQRRVLAVFHYALRPGGLLFLGPSETIGTFRDQFDIVDAKWKIFRRREGVASIQPSFSVPAEHGPRPIVPFTSPEVKLSNTTVTVQRLLLGQFAPPTVVADEHGNIIYIHGRTGLYLEPSQGQPRNNLFEMAREGLSQALLTAVRRAVSEKAEVVRERVPVKSNGGFTEVNLNVKRLDEPEAVRGLLMITFTQPQEAKHRVRRQKHGEEFRRIEEVERDLQYTRESLQTTIEELETSNEELKSTNEELQSTNEELQSTNEELETSKEELQSLNEELATVNTELQSKVDELAIANSDMQNLLNNTELATVFLDRDLKVKRFTERTRDVFNLIASDLGRPLSDMTSSLDYDRLVEDCQSVLQTLTVKEREVKTKQGDLYWMRIMPYRTIDNVIDGVVLTFVNLGQFRSRETDRAWIAGVIDPIQQPVVLLDSSMRVYRVNSEFCRLFNLNSADLEGRNIDEGENPKWVTDLVRKTLEAVAGMKEPYFDLPVQEEFPQVGRKLLLRARRVTIPLAGPDLMLLTFEPVPKTAQQE